MKHIILLYFIISFVVNIFAVMLTIFLYIKYKFNIILYYLFFILLLIFNFLVNTLNFYRLSFIVNNTEDYNIIYFYLKIIGQTLSYFFIPLFFINFFGLPFNIKKKIIFLILSITGFLFILVFSFFKLDYEQSIKILKKSIMFFSLVRLLIIIYIILLWLINKKKIKGYVINLFTKAIIITTILVFPFIILGVFFHKFSFYLDGRLISIPHLGIFIFIWNLISIIFTAWFFLNRVNMNKAEENLKILEKNFGITNREKEIILMVSKGYSNKEICDKLFISLPTVKTHLKNIYQKTNIKNRVKLVNLLKK